jgi:hypothetical protein
MCTGCTNQDSKGLVLYSDDLGFAKTKTGSKEKSDSTKDPETQAKSKYFRPL